jgi:threonine dehydrogenase-like Zn-dependent dehydrogenase
MKAVCWCGPEKMRVETVPDPKIINPRDAIVKITTTCICGSDLHFYDGYMPGMEKGDIVGHEFMGEVVDLGPEVKNLKRGDRVVVPFTICCGRCFYCKSQLWSACSNTNPDAWKLEKMYGYTGAGLFGYTHLYGGYAGGQAEYARVPMADVGPLKIPDGIPDEKVIFLSDILPTGYQAAEVCDIKPGDVIAVWGCGPVGLFAIKSAFLLGAERVIAIDRFPYRLRKAAKDCGAEVINYTEVDGVVDELRERTGGRGPDACIDAVGMEAHGDTFVSKMDALKQKVMLESDRPHVLRQAIQACRPGGTLSVPGVYGGLIDNFNIGAAFGKGLTFKMGQTHMLRYMKPLLGRIQKGEIDPSFVISHRVSLDQAPEMYRTFRDKQDECTKVVMKP